MADSGMKVIEAVRELLSTFGPDSVIQFSNPDGRLALPTVIELVQTPSGVTQYQSLALLAATIRWAATETGRDESTVLEELTNNYR